MTNGKKLWRCHVCNDIHLGMSGPEICPTCRAKNAFVESDFNEAIRIIGEGENLVTEKEVIRVWEEFAHQAGLSLNEDRHMVETLAKGVLENQTSHGLRYCPCRITTGDPERDLRLVCPCNFFVQKTWKERNECWCGLFVKR